MRASDLCQPRSPLSTVTNLSPKLSRLGQELGCTQSDSPRTSSRVASLRHPDPNVGSNGPLSTPITNLYMYNSQHQGFNMSPPAQSFQHVATQQASYVSSRLAEDAGHGMVAFSKQQCYDKMDVRGSYCSSEASFTTSVQRNAAEVAETLEAQVRQSVSSNGSCLADFCSH